MKKAIAAMLTIALLLSISACGTSEKELIWDKTVGAIFVNDTEVLPEHEKLYASFENNTYSFDLDAAWVYYFNYDAETAYAGSHNFTALTFGASLDDGNVGAEGTAAWLFKEDVPNTVTAYYLWWDGNGVYFDTAEAFDHIQIQPEGATTMGYDYLCAVTFTAWQPISSFTMTQYTKNGMALTSTELTPEQVEDNQKFTLSDEVAYVEIVCYGTEGETLEVLTVTPENPKAAICYESGGQFLPSKLLRFVWE